MKSMEREQPATENLLATYKALAKNHGKMEILSETNTLVCTSEIDHPICNFAATYELDPTVAQKLKTLALAKKHFNAYVLPGPHAEATIQQLEKQGFRPCYSLSQMTYTPESSDSQVEICEAENEKDRLRVATFMADQFFSAERIGFRSFVKEATAAAKELNLYKLEKNNEIIGAVMLCHTPGVVGFYNLCVRSAFRRRGYGRQMVWEICQVAAKEKKYVTLQCEPKLENWYASQGFSVTGYVKVFALSKIGTVI